MTLFSTRMPSSGRFRPWGTWVYADNKPLQVLGVPLVPPRCGIRARRHHAEMVLMNELWFAVVPPPSAPTSYVMLLPEASTVLSGAEALLCSSNHILLETIMVLGRGLWKPHEYKKRQLI